MTQSKDFSHRRHRCFAIHVHLVFAAKHRYRVLDGEATNRLGALFTKICTDFASELVEMEGEAN
jgi:putative transposase